MQKTFEIKKDFKIILNSLDKFFHSNYFFLTVLIISIVGFAFDLQVVAMILICIMMSLSFISSRDILPAIMLLLFLTIIPHGMDVITFEKLQPIIYVAIVLVPTLIARFFMYPIKYKADKFFWTQLAYSVALILAGVGYTTLKSYGELVPFVVMVGLGFGQLLFFVIFDAYVNKVEEESFDYFAKMMATVCGMIILIYISYYLKAIPYFKTNGFNLVYKQSKNYLAYFGLIGLPFCFYLGLKKSFSWYILAISTYCIIVISLCRGGLLCGTVETIFLVIYTYLKSNKKQRLYQLIYLAFTLGFSIFIFFYFYEFVTKYISSSINHGSSGRIVLYEDAIKAFKENPIFGVGFGYKNPDIFDTAVIKMHYVHSTIFQLLCSAGILGLGTYAVVAYLRIKTMFDFDLKKVIILISFLSFAGYSLIDIGTMMPLPFMMLVTLMTVMSYKLSGDKKYLTNKNLIQINNF